MRTISDVPGHREVELEPIELRHHDYVDRLLDEGWGFHVAVKYSEKRFGPMTPAFRNWIMY